MQNSIVDSNSLVGAYNYSSYVLFPSDSFDLSPQQLEEQQQLQQQGSSYYPIEDVLANLIR
jgi:hypothetical protein